MKRSIFVIFGLAVFAAFLVFILMTGFVKPRAVVIAKADLAAGTRLSADVLEVVQVPKGSVQKDAFSSLDEAVGKVLTTARVAGDAITPYVAGEGDSAAGIPGQLSPGTVAMSIRVDQATGLAGIVRPGQQVAVIAVVDPQSIAMRVSAQTSVFSLATPNPESTPEATPTPQPPLAPVARLTIHGLRVLVVPQAFRYEEVPQTQGQDALFANARTTMAGQQGSVILLEVPVEPVEIAPGYSISPAELLALLNNVATIHLALEPSGGLSVTTDLLPVDLAELYTNVTGHELP